MINSICDDNYLWKRLVRRDFAALEENKDRIWKEIYQERSAYVLIFITSKDCIHCPHVERKWLLVEDWLRKKYKFRFVTLKFKTCCDKVIDYGFDQKLQLWIHWFPSWILFPIQEWKTGQLSIGNRFMARFSKIDNVVSYPPPDRKQYERNNAGVDEWIQDSISTFKHNSEK